MVGSAKGVVSGSSVPASTVARSALAGGMRGRIGGMSNVQTTPVGGVRVGASTRTKAVPAVRGGAIASKTTVGATRVRLDTRSTSAASAVRRPNTSASGYRMGTGKKES